METQNSSNIFHITVGATPSNTKQVSLEHDLQLLKAAFLYGDKVKLCSPASSLLISLIHWKQLSDEEWLSVCAKIYPPMEQALELYQKLSRGRRRSGKEIITLKKLQAHLNKSRDDGKAYFENLATQAGLQHLDDMFSTGRVEIQMFDGADSATITQQYFDVVSDAILSGKTYPLFDDVTGDIVSLAVKEGKIQPSTVAINRAKQVGLSADLLNRLPLFDTVPFDRLIDIRQELDRPLQRFRSAIIKFTRDIESAAWDKDFPLEADQVFREHVQPAILDIEEACRANKLLSSFLPNLVDKPVIPVTTSALGVVLAGASQSPSMIAAGLAAGGITVALRTVQEWQEKNRGIESNQLYFYYKTGKLISS